MYHHFSGTLENKSNTEAIVDCGGVGYVLRIPYSTAAALPDVGRRVKLLAYQHFTQDGPSLYGFATAEEREFFQQLITVSGVGPKLALAVLSGGRVEDIQQAIRLGDFASLKRIKGVGEGTAKKIVLELGKILIHQTEVGRASVPVEPGGQGRPPLPVIAPGLDRETQDAVRAVVQLQEVPPDVALQAVQRAYSELSAASSERPTVQAVVQRAMKYAS